MIYDGAQFPRARLEATQRVLFEAARTSEGARQPATRRWLTAGTSWLTVGAIGVGGAAAIGAGLLLAPTAPTESDTVDCHTTTALGDGDRFTGTSMQFLRADAHEGDVAPDPVSACSWMWRDGWLVYGSGPVEPTPGTINGVPDLTACVTGRGVAAVFPADESICAQLGLAPLG